jgi:hypothetical protein
MRREVQVALALALAVPCIAAADPPPPAKVERPEFVVAAVAPPAGVARGEEAALEVTLEARGTFHVNAEYPSSFRVADAPAGLRYPRAKIDRASGLRAEPCADRAGDRKGQACRVRVTVPFVAEAAGTHAVGGVLAFSVCDKERCLIEKIALAAPVTAR